MCLLCQDRPGKTGEKGGLHHSFGQAERGSSQAVSVYRSAAVLGRSDFGTLNSASDTAKAVSLSSLSSPETGALR